MEDDALEFHAEDISDLNQEVNIDGDAVCKANENSLENVI